jgi:hypothetical protein
VYFCTLFCKSTLIKQLVIKTKNLLALTNIGVLINIESNESTTPVLPTHMVVKDSDLNSVPAAKGKEFMLGKFSVYESPLFTNDLKILLITVYDIFGFHPHVKYIADELAKSGFMVVIPDLFHGKPVPLQPVESFPPAK